MKKLLKPLVALTIVVAMVVPAVAMAEAAPARQSQSARQEQKAVQWLADNISITQTQLSPGAKRFVNWLLAVSTPVFCPIVGKIAAPELADFVVQGCLGIGTSADPWTTLGQFVPLLCGDPGAIFPKYEDLFVTACMFL